MVGDDERDLGVKLTQEQEGGRISGISKYLNVKLASLHTEENIIKTVANLRHHEHDSCFLRDRTNLIFEVVFLDKFLDRLG